MAKRLPVFLLLLVMCSSLAESQIVPTRVRVSQGVMQGLLEKKVQPEYPPDARDQRIQGVVLLKVNIDQEGNVYKVELINGHPLLAPAAMAAVQQWKYRPYLLNGVAVNVETQAQVNFTLAEKPAAEGVAGDAPGTAPPDTVGGIAPSTPNEGQQKPPQRIRVSRDVMQGMIIKKVQPAYPPDARAQHIEGLVWLKVKIDPEGNVINVELISGHPLLAPAAMDAVKQWKFRPYLLNSTPLEVETQVQVNFTLAGK